MNEARDKNQNGRCAFHSSFFDWLTELKSYPDPRPVCVRRGDTCPCRLVPPPLSDIQHGNTEQPVTAAQVRKIVWEELAQVR
jgi:hypothetical protein